MPGTKEQELSRGSEHAASHSKVNEGAIDEEAVPSRASTSLEHWEAQSVDKAAPSALPAFEEDDDRGLSRTFRLSIIFGSGLMMLAVVLCLVLVLPRSAHKSPKHDNSSKLVSLHQFHLLHIRMPPQLLLHPLLYHHRNRYAHHQHAADQHSVQNKQNAALTDAPLITTACRATRFPDTCEASLLTEPSARAATTVSALADSAISISHTQALSLGHLSQDVLSASDNVNLTTAAGECVYLLGRAASFHGKVQVMPLSSQAPWQVADSQAWMSAALTYENDCWSALSYANTTKAVDSLMAKLRDAITITSNALSMVDAYREWGYNTKAWASPTRLTLFRAVQPPREGSSGDWWQKTALTVALDGTGDYTSVQAAVDAAPEEGTTWFVIHVRAGVYAERVRIPSTKTKLAFIGDGMGKTIITGALNAQMPGMTTYDSATVAVDGDGFVAIGMTFENTAGPEKHQAVALRVDSDFAAFYNCSFLGHQDTLYAHSLRQFYRGCQIEGTIDFIFGNAAAVFQECIVLFRPGLPSVGVSVVTAQGRTDPAETTALVFLNCMLSGTEQFLQATPKQHRSYLGRPWKSFSRTLFLECMLAGFFRPEGWLPWNGTFALDTLFYGEYMNTGPGAPHPHSRVPWSTSLSSEIAQYFTVAPFIQGDRWLPATNVPFSLSL